MNISTIKLTHQDYPELLKEIANRPKQLHAIGNLSLLKTLCVAIVGARRASSYGRAVTQQLAGDLASSGVTIVSGLALGIDGYAHRAALEAGGHTIAVMACGLNRIYPSTHRELAATILRKDGLLLSEYPVGTEPFKHRFLERNRIISGISQAVVVTEAAARSGSLATARFCLEQNRELLAVPGNITSPLSGGTNNLLRMGAGIAETAEDVLSAIGWTAELSKPVPSGDPEQDAILTLIDQDIHDIEELIAHSGIETAQFNQALTMLEITGRIRNVGGGNWVRRS